MSFEERATYKIVTTQRSVDDLWSSCVYTKDYVWSRDREITEKVVVWNQIGGSHRGSYRRSAHGRAKRWLKRYVKKMNAKTPGGSKTTYVDAGGERIRGGSGMP